MAEHSQTTAGAPLSREWMIEHFGEPYPPEVVDLLFDRSTDDTRMGEVRAQVRRLGEQRRRERGAHSNA